MSSTNILHHPVAIPSKCLVTVFKYTNNGWIIKPECFNICASLQTRSAASLAVNRRRKGCGVKGQRVFPQSVTPELHCLNNIKVGHLCQGGSGVLRARSLTGPELKYSWGFNCKLW